MNFGMRILSGPVLLLWVYKAHALLHYPQVTRPVDKMCTQRQRHHRIIEVYRTTLLLDTFKHPYFSIYSILCIYTYV